MQLRHLFESVENFSTETDAGKAEENLEYFRNLYKLCELNSDVLFETYNEQLLLAYAFSLSQPPQQIITGLIEKYLAIDKNVLFSKECYAKVCILRRLALKHHHQFFFNYLLINDHSFKKHDLQIDDLAILLHIALTNNNIEILEALLEQFEHKSPHDQVTILTSNFNNEILLFQLYKFNGFDNSFAVNLLEKLFLNKAANNQTLEALLSVKDLNQKNIVHVFIDKFFLQHNMENENSETFSFTSMVYLPEQNELKLILDLIDRNIDVQSYFWESDVEGDTPMTFIIGRSATEKMSSQLLLDYLLRRFSENKVSLLEQLNKPLDLDQNTILHQAYALRNAHAVALLQYYGANPFLENSRNYRPIQLLGNYDEVFIEFVKELAERGLLIGQALPKKYIEVLKTIQNTSTDFLFLVGASFRKKLLHQSEFRNPTQVIVDPTLAITKLAVLKQIAQQEYVVGQSQSAEQLTRKEKNKKIIEELEIGCEIINKILHQSHQTFAAMLRLKLEVKPIEFEPLIKFLAVATLIHGKLKDYMFYLQYHPDKKEIYHKFFARPCQALTDIRGHLELPSYVSFLAKNVDQQALVHDRGYILEGLKAWQAETLSYVNHLPNSSWARIINCTLNELLQIVGFLSLGIGLTVISTGLGIYNFSDNGRKAISNHAGQHKPHGEFDPGLFFGILAFTIVSFCAFVVLFMALVFCLTHQCGVQFRPSSTEKAKLKELISTLTVLISQIEEDNRLDQNRHLVEIKSESAKVLKNIDITSLSTLKKQFKSLRHKTLELNKMIRRNYPYIVDEDSKKVNLDVEATIEDNFSEHPVQDRIFARRLISFGRRFVFFPTTDHAWSRTSDRFTLIDDVNESIEDDVESGEAVEMTLVRYGSPGQSTSSQ